MIAKENFFNFGVKHFYFRLLTLKILAVPSPFGGGVYWTIYMELDLYRYSK